MTFRSLIYHTPLGVIEGNGKVWEPKGRGILGIKDAIRSLFVKITKSGTLRPRSAQFHKVPDFLKL
jgi:hypothetical protein